MVTTATIGGCKRISTTDARCRIEQFQLPSDVGLEHTSSHGVHGRSPNRMQALPQFVNNINGSGDTITLFGEFTDAITSVRAAQITPELLLIV